MSATTLLRSSGPTATAVILSFGAPAWAQASDTIATAEALFDAGREGMVAGDFANACPKLAESQRLDPQLGTLLNLALCHAKQGRTATAWAEYRTVAELASRAGEPAREREAEKQIRGLEGRLAKVRIRAPDGVHIRIDGRDIGAPRPWERLFPWIRERIPWTHTSKGRKPYSQTFVVADAASESTLSVPTLAPEGAPASLSGAACGSTPRGVRATERSDGRPPRLGSRSWDSAPTSGCKPSSRRRRSNESAIEIS